MKPLGRWTLSSHHKWEWYYYFENNVMERQTSDGVVYFRRGSGRRRTCRERKYTLLWQDKDDIPSYKLASVTVGDDGNVVLNNVGPHRSKSPSGPTGFWAYLQEHGREWMWDGVEEEGQDFS